MTHNYIPLHLHTEKSLMDGTATAEEYAKRAHELGMPSLAVTDHGTMSSHREFAKATEALGIKPIFGIEAYVTHDINDRRDRASRTEPLDRIYNHLTIIAKNKTGYKNLSRLNEIAWTEGYFHKPRIDFDLLDRYSDGLIIGSACMGGLLNSAIEVGDFAVAKRHLNTLHDIAGDDFYVELMPHNNTSTDVEGINRMLIELADANNIKTIVTPDCHHAHKGQKVIQEIMLIANVHPKELTEDQVLKQDQDGRGPSYIDLDPQDAVYMNKLDSIYGHDRMMTFNKFDIHLLSGQEMWDGMLNDARQDSFDNTLEIDSKVDHIELPQGLDLLPVNFENPAETIKVRCTEFLDNGGYGQEYYDRLAEETSIITDLGFDAYFLIVNDIVQWAAKQGIMTGPGRGSGVGSLVNFALGNTGVDPIEHNLLFFRFIDPSRRGDWPDIDTDFMDRRRGEVKAYVAEKYGNVASIATYQKFKGKGMIKDIARVFRIPLSEVSRVNKLIDTWEEYKESSSVKWFRDKYPQVEIYGDELKGRTRGTGMHASGLVAARAPLAEVAPIETRSTPGGKDRMPVIAVDMEETAEIGLIKLDILGLKALSTISDTLDLIKQRTRKPIDLNKIPMDDHAVYQMLSEGHTSGIFQAEQAPYTKLLIQMGVDNFNDLVATNALIRPGAAKTIGKDYVMRKLGTQRITYVHEDTKSFTKDTYGLFVYQEQIMLLCTELAGMSMVEANKVRKITSKKKDASALAEYRSKFVDGASAKIGEEGASKLWDDILKWSEYGFNQSHSVAYSVLTYWMAWLKYYYAIEFMTATLINEGDKNSRTQYLIEAKRMGIKVALPHINKSQSDFTIERDAIRMGLSSVKYISDKIAARYVSAAPFESYAAVEKFTFTKGNGVNSRALASLNAIGALSFSDNPMDRDAVKSNLYEYLNLPEVAVSIPEHWPAFMTTADDFEDQGAHIMIGIVTNVRRGKGWSLITIMDNTGTFGVFDAEDTMVVKGGSYLMLIGSNRIVTAVPLSEIDNEQNEIVKWLNAEDAICAPNELFVLSFSSRKTKAGQSMATMIVSTHDRDIYPVTVFARQYPVARAKLIPGNSYRISCEEGRDGGWIFKSVE